MSTIGATRFVCLETFRPGNATSCLRYEHVKRCIKEGTANNIPFLCVGQDTISIGGGGPLDPLPRNLTTSVFLCDLTACPNAAPPEEPKPDKKGSPKNSTGNSTNNSTDNSTTLSSASSVKSISLSGVFILILVITQVVLF